MNPTSAQKRIAFGYNRNNGHIAINEGQAALVKLIYEWYAEGRGLGEIKEMLEELHVPSPQNKPTWGKQALSNILSNPHYLGLDVYPAIVTQELFDVVQTIKSAKAARHSGRGD